MPRIIKYTPITTPETTHQIALPEADPPCQELATVAGEIYISLPTDAVLPAQPPEIAASIVEVTPDDTLRAAIIAASPHCRLIDERMRSLIRDAYPLEDELKYARIGVGAANGLYQPTADEIAGMMAFGAHVEAVRQWGRDQRAALGL